MSNAAISDVGQAVEGRRRRFTPEQKRALLAEATKPGSSVSETARRYGVSPSLLFKWKAAMDDATDKSLKKNERVVPESEVIHGPHESHVLLDRIGVWVIVTFVICAIVFGELLFHYLPLNSVSEGIRLW